MAPTATTRYSLLLLLLVSCSASLLPVTSATDTLPCPQQVTSALISADYLSCQRDVAALKTPWVLTADHADTIAHSDACQATLRALQAIEFDSCVATILSNDSRLPIRVTVDKASLGELTTTTTRRLRHAITRVLQDSNTQASSFDYTYLYGGIAISLVVMLVVCLLSRGGVCCFCIPIPLCC